MASVNVAVFSEGIGRIVGKKSGDSDITFYDRIADKVLFTGLHPKAYPDKIFALTQAVYLSNFVVLDVAKIDAELGEKIIAIDSLGKKNGLLVPRVGIDVSQLKPLLAGTVVEHYPVVSEEEVSERLLNFTPPEVSGSAIVDVDSCFDVKSVGTVALGYVRQGTVKKYDALELMPAGKECTVRSIQAHDMDVPEAGCPTRVGLAIKGIAPTDVKRGSILAAKGSTHAVTELQGAFSQCKYYKKEIKAEMQLHVQIGLAVVGCRVKGTAPFSLSLSQPVAISGDENALLIDISGKPRIAGTLRLK